MSLEGGKWYYEVVVVVPGRASIGWADDSYTGGTVGGCRHSWGFDGLQKAIRNSGQNEVFGEAWGAGDVIGCCLDLEVGCINYGWNGAPMSDAAAPAFSSRRAPSGGSEESSVRYGDGTAWGKMTPAISFEASMQCSVNFGEMPFRHAPPNGYRSVRHWVHEFVENHHVLANRSRFAKVS